VNDPYAFTDPDRMGEMVENRPRTDARHAPLDEAGTVIPVGPDPIPPDLWRRVIDLQTRQPAGHLERERMWTPGEAFGDLLPPIGRRGAAEPIFLNRRGQPLTRFGVSALLERHAARAAGRPPSPTARRVSPHPIRHARATHLLRPGVGINTTRAWPGRLSPATTNVSAEADRETKTKAPASGEVAGQQTGKPW
jgi:hypothetical protein